MALFSWFQRVEPVQFMAIDGRSLTFKSKKAFKVGARPTISIALPGEEEEVEFRLPVTISNVRQVGPNAVVCTGEVPGAAKDIEDLRQILEGLDPAAGAPVDVDDQDAMRRAPRYMWSIRILSKDLPGFRAVSLDFNRLGLKLSTEGKMEENKIISMMLEIETSQTREVLCQAIVRWCKEVSRRKYEVGVEFTELDGEVAKELKAFENFLEARFSGDVTHKSISDNVHFGNADFGPGVEAFRTVKAPEVKQSVSLANPESPAEESPESPDTPAAEETPTE